MKAIGLVSILLLGGLLIYGAADFPDWADPTSPACTHVSPYYIEKTMSDTSVPNIVTAVLADYRGYDTMFETTVIFAAAIACLFLLRIFSHEGPESRLYRHILTDITLRIEKGGKIPEESAEFERIDSSWTPHDVIIKTTSRLIIPFIQIFSLYVIAHGHHSPGGGFQGGVILGASLILFAISHNLRSAIKRVGEKAGSYFYTTGIFIYAGTGVVCLLLGCNFLDYSALARIFGTNPIAARSYGILIVEIGVGIAVMMVMISLYNYLASVGRQDEGL